jgi:hypothetical protein
MDVFAELKRLGSLIRQIQGALGGRRYDVQGVVSSTGTATGVGFSASKTSTGTYAIVYGTAFASGSVPQATLGATSSVSGVAITSSSATGCTVVTFNGSGLIDGQFFFSANGP